MRNPRLNLDRLMEATFAHFRDLPRESIDSAGARVLSHLRRQAEWQSGAVHYSPQRTLAFRWKWPVIVTLAAGLVLAVFLPARVSQSDAAVFETGAESRSVDYGELVHSGTSDGSTLKLQDGSTLELRRESELTVSAT